MTRLYLFRHGLAMAHGTPGILDDDRPLTEKGARRVRQVARGLRKAKVKVDRIVSSPLPRALKTAEIVAETLKIPYLLESDTILLPASSAAEIAAWLHDREEPRIMLVGHNPNLSQLLSLLTTGQPDPILVALRKAGLAELRQNPTGAYHIESITRPRLIRRLTDGR
jgi:phosphohistidine phosphatase